MSSMENQNKQPISNEEDEDFSFAMQLAEISVLPMVMQVATELDVFEIIAKAGPGAQLSPKFIASQLVTKNPEAENMLDRILRVLASYSVLTSSLVTNENGLVERLYGLASVCKYFIRNADGVSLAPFLLLVQDKVFMDSWFHLKDTVLEGGNAFSRAHGMHAFEYPGVDQRFNQVFNRGMFNHTTIFMKKVLEIYKGFEDLKELVDVGGGVGTTISLITSKYPTIKGINFDLPHVIAQAPSYPVAMQVAVELELFEIIAKAGPNAQLSPKEIASHLSKQNPNAANMLDRILRLLTSYSVTTSSLVTNKDGQDERLYGLAPENGKLIIVEAILPVAPETNTAAKVFGQSDLIMMSTNPGGKERTEEEFRTLAKGAGFVGMKKVVCIYNMSWVIEFYKK